MFRKEGSSRSKKSTCGHAKTRQPSVKNDAARPIHHRLIPRQSRTICGLAPLYQPPENGQSMAMQWHANAAGSKLWRHRYCICSCARRCGLSLRQPAELQDPAALAMVSALKCSTTRTCSLTGSHARQSEFRLKPEPRCAKG